MHDGRLANLLGATALAVTDLTTAGVTGAAGVSASGAAAMVVLLDAPGLGVTELGRRVGLTQSAAARMVDALESAGLAARRAGAGRAVRVHPTDAGRDAARRLLAARESALSAVLDPLDDTDRERLTALLSALLTRLYARIGDADRICRLCDRTGCVRDAVCPVGQADRDRRG